MLITLDWVARTDSDVRFIDNLSNDGLHNKSGHYFQEIFFSTASEKYLNIALVLIIFDRVIRSVIFWDHWNKGNLPIPKATNCTDFFLTH